MIQKEGEQQWETDTIKEGNSKVWSTNLVISHILTWPPPPHPQLSTHTHTTMGSLETKSSLELGGKVTHTSGCPHVESLVVTALAMSGGGQ